MLEVIHRPKYRLTGKKLPPIKSKLIKKDGYWDAIYLGRKNKFLYVIANEGRRKWIIPINREKVSKLIERWEDIRLVNVNCRNCDIDCNRSMDLSGIVVSSTWSIYTKSEGTVVGTMAINALLAVPLVLSEQAAYDLSGHVKIHDAYIVNPNNVFYNTRKINTKKEEK